MKNSNSELKNNDKRRTTRKDLYNSDTSHFLLKGLNSNSIIEFAVPLKLNGSYVGDFQAVEIYKKFSGGTPQIIADIISNSYLRLSYPKINQTSATFGTSVIACPSFRTLDKNLRLIPQSQAAALIVNNTEVEIKLFANFDDLASFISVRTFQTQQEILSNVTNYKIFFKASKDIYLDKSSSAFDMFRFATISSMFASSKRYDANVIEYSEQRGEPQQLVLNEDCLRSTYIFNSLTRANTMAAIKTTGAIGKMYSPGSFDSPSIQVKWIDGSISASDIGVQAYLDKSTNINDDSLSIWLEWVTAPALIAKGFEIWAEFEVRALAPRIK